MDTIRIGEHEFQGHTLQLLHGRLLAIVGTRGMLGCGYFNCETADKLGDALAIVTGVAGYDDMLNATVRKVSAAAAELGVTPGMTGRDALEAMK